MSRIKERYDETCSTRDAMRGQLVQFGQMGFGVAVALLIDATIIRSVLLPSMLTLLGERAWYLPRWLDWLPHIEVERPATRAS